MLSHYLKTAFRNLAKSRSVSLLHVGGLAIGMAAFLLILHHVSFERGYDRFFPDSGRIYRLRYERISENGEAVRFASCCPPAGGLVRDRFPEVEALARLFRYRAVVAVGDRQFTEERMYFAEPDFQKLLPRRFLSGDPANGIRAPNRAFISRAIARKYFGRDDPLGRTFSVDRKTDYQVAGVFADSPPDTHLKTDILLSFRNLLPLYGPDLLDSWGDTGFFTYLKLRPGTDLAALRAKLRQLVQSSFGDALRSYRMQMILPLQPLQAIHLESHFMQEHESNGSREAVDTLFWVAFFILIMAWINYINLSTARALTRAREVGLRKAVGATRRQLMAQFFLETALVNLLAVLMALLLVQLATPLFRLLTGIPETVAIWRQGWFRLALPLLLLAGIVFSGLYPVIVLTSFVPEAVLKNRAAGAARGLWLRKTLALLQFVAALVLLIGTFAIFRQIRFLQSREPGFHSESVVVIKAPRVRGDAAGFAGRFDSFRQSLLGQAEIRAMCMATEVPGRQVLWDAGGIRRAGEDESRGKNYQIVGVDYDFVPLFQLQLAAGRNFSRAFPADSGALLLNETAVRWMGFAGPAAALGQRVTYWDDTFTIVGVLRDFRQQSPKQPFEPHLYRLMPYGRDVRGHIVVQANRFPGSRLLATIRSRFDRFFPGNPFEYFYLDRYVDEQFEADRAFGRAVALFAGLAVLLSALGVFGLSSFMALQRRKEIGIRKVLGAGAPGILLLLSREYLTLLLGSFLAAAPLALLAVASWLRTFASRMPLDAALLLLPLLLVSAVTLATIAGHIVRAARANPVDAIRCE